MKRKILKILSCSFLLTMVVSCKNNKNDSILDNSSVGSSVQDSSSIEDLNHNLNSTAPTYQLEDHSSNYIDDNYKNYTQILVYSYYDSNGDGIGDLKGLISKLDYINNGDKNSKTSIGYDGIYMLPIFPSPSYHKYDATNYYDIDKSYGTLEDFDKLMSEANKRGIDIILDLAVNHTSTQHPWFQSAIADLKKNNSYDPNTKGVPDYLIENNKYLGYYNFTTDVGFRSEEYEINNSAKKWVPISGTDWFYEEQFSGGNMPDLNLANEDVKAEIKNIMKFWLDKGVKGFRFDACEHFFDENKRKSYAFINELRSWGDELTKDRDKKFYMVGEGPWSSLVTDYYENTNAHSFMNFHLGAGSVPRIANMACYAKDYLETIKAITEAGNKYTLDDQYNVVVGNRKTNSAATYFSRVIKTWDDMLYKANPNAIDANFGVNHDTLRASNFIARSYKNNELENGLKLFWGINNTLSGVTFNYYGEEVGMRAGNKDNDPDKRQPMYWSTSNREGITNVPPGGGAVTQILSPVDVQMNNPTSLWNYIREINRMKSFFPEIARGKQEFVSAKADFTVLKKTYNNSSIYLVYNFNTDTNQIPLEDLGIENVPTEIKYSVSSNDKYAKLTETTLNVPGYSITIL